MADELTGIPDEYQGAVNKIIGERLKRQKETLTTEWGEQLRTAKAQIDALTPKAAQADEYRVKYEGLVTRAERDAAYPAALKGEDKAAIRERLERLYDAEPADAEGKRPTFAEWFASDPLAAAIAGTIPAAPPSGGGQPGTPAVPPAGGAAPRGLPSANAGAANPQAPGKPPTPMEHRAAHAALIKAGKTAEAATYLQEHMLNA